MLKKAFSSFGDVRMVDIPMLDPYRHKVTRSFWGENATGEWVDWIFHAEISWKHGKRDVVRVGYKVFEIRME